MLILFLILYAVVSIIVSAIHYNQLKEETTSFLDVIYNHQLKKEARLMGIFWIATVPYFLLKLLYDVCVDFVEGVLSKKER